MGRVTVRRAPLTGSGDVDTGETWKQSCNLRRLYPWYWTYRRHGIWEKF